jgi:hypothetical protein
MAAQADVNVGDKFEPLKFAPFDQYAFFEVLTSSDLAHFRTSLQIYKSYNIFS